MGAGRPRAPRRRLELRRPRRRHSSRPSQIFRRLRTHDVHVMPEDQAEALLARLRAEQVERHREREAREGAASARGSRRLGRDRSRRSRREEATASAK